VQEKEVKKIPKPKKGNKGKVFLLCMCVVIRNCLILFLESWRCVRMKRQRQNLRYFHTLSSFGYFFSDACKTCKLPRTAKGKQKEEENESNVSDQVCMSVFLNGWSYKYHSLHILQLENDFDDDFGDKTPIKKGGKKQTGTKV
jgi:hypothetical protein